MNILDQKITQPKTAFFVIFVMSALLSEYGIVEGSLLLFDFFAAIIIYKWLTRG